MKRLLLCFTLAMFTFGYSYAAKEQSVTEVAQKEMSAKVDKDSRKRAKAMAKAGWQTLPGRVTMEKQIERSKIAELSVDEDGNNIYILGYHQALGGNYSAAKNIATVRAKAELASNLKDAIKQAVVDKNANKQIDPKTIELLDETIAAIMTNAEVELTNINNLMEIYRNAEDNKCEVMITLSVKADVLIAQAVAKLREELASKSDLVF